MPPRMLLGMCVCLSALLAMLPACAFAENVASSSSSQPATARTATSASAPQTQLSSADLLKERIRLEAQMLKHFQAKEYEQAAAVCREFIRLFPKMPDGYYNLACALARQEQADPAVEALQKAISLGYDDPEHMSEDADLALLRDRKDFKDMLEKARAAALAFEEMPGVKTVVRMPEGGLRYRIRMSPEATKDKPNKLIIWLHPSGASGNAGVEAMAPIFLKHGFALAVFPKKNFAMWSQQDAEMLMDKSLPDMAGVEGLDSKKPILLGFSAGGQLAIKAWEQDPSFFGGLILDAAYPVVQTPSGFQLSDLPDKKGVKDVPILVFVGEDDGGAKIWRKAQTQWLDKGVPLTVVYVPKAVHAWLLTPKHVSERGELEKWLAAVAEGKKPSSQPASQAASQAAQGSHMEKE